MRQGLGWLWLAASLAGLLACGGDDSTDTGPGVSSGNKDDGGAETVCIDKDDDGFSPNCSPADCDDMDPDITDECTRCKKPNEDCPCDRGTQPTMCEPPDIEVEGGRLECKEGTRYCRQGRWSECEVVGEYVFVPNP